MSRHLRPSPLTPSMTNETHRARTPSQNRSLNPSRSQRRKTRRSQAFQGSYRFNDEQSLLYVQVFKDNNTLGARAAHNHTIRSTNWTGELTRNGAGTDCRVSLTLPVEGLVVDEPQMRRRVGYNDEISDNQRAEIRGHMLADNQLNINAPPDDDL